MPRKAFRIVKTPTDSHHTGHGTSIMNRAELDRPSCPACYTPGFEPGYCTRCVEHGRDAAHRSNRKAGW